MNTELDWKTNALLPKTEFLNASNDIDPFGLNLVLVMWFHGSGREQRQFESRDAILLISYDDRDASR